MEQSTNAQTLRIMMIAVAFIDGALRITNIPTFYLWKDYLGVSPGVNCLLRYITKLPWCVKPFFAYFSDRYYIWGYRTKIYFILMGIIQIVTFMFLAVPNKNVIWTTFLILVGEATVAFRDSLAEGLMVVISREEDAKNAMLNGKNSQESSSQKYVSVIFVLRFFGTLASSFVAGILLERFTPQQILGMCSIFPLVNLLHALFFFGEKRVLDTTEIVSKFESFRPGEIFTFIEKNDLTSFLLYVVVMLVWPNTISGVRYYLIDTLGFSTYDIGTIFTLSSLFYLIYMFFLNTFFPNYKYRNFFVAICIMMAINIAARSLQIVPSLKSLAYLFAVIDQTVNNLFYDLPMIPLLAIVCRICPRLQEATYYAFFVSVSNFFCSLANFTGFLYLDLMDVTTTNFSNIQVVNMLGLLWAAMMWHMSLYIKFPDADQFIISHQRKRQKEETIKEQKKIKEMQKEEKLYSTPGSQEID